MVGNTLFSDQSDRRPPLLGCKKKNKKMGWSSWLYDTVSIPSSSFSFSFVCVFLFVFEDYLTFNQIVKSSFFPFFFVRTQFPCARASGSCLSCLLTTLLSLVLERGRSTGIRKWWSDREAAFRVLGGRETGEGMKEKGIELRPSFFSTIVYKVSPTLFSMLIIISCNRRKVYFFPFSHYFVSYRARARRVEKSQMEKKEKTKKEGKEGMVKCLSTHPTKATKSMTLERGRVLSDTVKTETKKIEDAIIGAFVFGMAIRHYYFFLKINQILLYALEGKITKSQKTRGKRKL